eukprot:TRINITY_DN225_c0_g1_i1.p1 TRINITY_DN225_c0_g1~~TRINITY_DN225_c0_g1_i1.p1  ORF type:complete len:217 (+),score=44.95 TRINITY_DN225_c0_g1_i1:96-653(+)
MAARPCAHNNWEDLRGRKQHKCLRCFDCGARWQVVLSRCGGWCKNFHRGVCSQGVFCNSLHVTGRVRTANAQAALVVAVASPLAQNDSPGGSTPGHDSQVPSTLSPLGPLLTSPTSTSDHVSAHAPHDSLQSFDNGRSSRKSGSVKVRFTGDTEWNQLEVVYPDEAPWVMTDVQLDAMLRAHGLA